VRAALLAAATLAVLGTAACSNNPDADGAAGAGAERSGMPETPLRITGPKDDALLARFPEAIRTSGVLTLAADPTYPPSTFKDPQGTIVGISADFAAAVKAKTGLDVKWVEVPFDGMLAGLKAHRFDASWSGWNVTAERLQVLNIVTYMNGGTSVLVKKGNTAGIAQETDLCGRTVTAQTGTFQAQTVLENLQAACAKAGRPAAVPLLIPQQTNVNQALATGRADVALADNTLVAYQARVQPDLFEAVPSILIAPRPVGVATPKDATQLAEALAATYNALIADGTYAAILDRWGISNSAVRAAEVNPLEPT
jgi:polar amino acid transport system substrate-binding protein